MNFKELLRNSIKSGDTEENIDIYFTRPIGLLFTLFYKALGVHPNWVTIIGIAIGMVAGYMFYFQDLYHNILGVILLTIANFHDSADGQLARLTGKKTLVGRMLDGFSADAIFFAVYLAIVIRLFNQPMPFGISTNWGWFGFLLCLCAGILGHSRQCAVADYYRQLHLLFLKGKDFAEFDTYAAQVPKVEAAKREKRWLDWAFYFNYRNYCRRQERMTPDAQKFLTLYFSDKQQNEGENKLITERFLKGSRPLMKWTNFLTYNWRAITLFISCLVNEPWIYPLVELTIFNGVREYMRIKHERLCRQLTSLITEQR